MTDADTALTALERRVAALEAASASASPGRELAPAPAEPTALWIVDGLREQAGGAAAVAFAGIVPDGDAGAVPGPLAWQYGVQVDAIAEADWGEGGAAEALAALGHPARLRILQAVLAGDGATAELGAIDGVGSTGSAYHHLAQLRAAGWIRAAARGRSEVPPERVVPLLVAVLATGAVA